MERLAKEKLILINLFLVILLSFPAFAEDVIPILPSEREVKETQSIIYGSSIDASVLSSGPGTEIPLPVAKTDTDAFSFEEDSRVGVFYQDGMAFRKLTDLGEFKITGYCTCEKCCGKNSINKLTYTDTIPTAGRTVATDKNKIPMGSYIIIQGKEGTIAASYSGVYHAEDTGSAVKDKVIDIYCPSHEEACNIGASRAEVWLATPIEVLK